MTVGITPDYIIGDFDSCQKPKNLSPDCIVIELNRQKDVSDLEYAVGFFLNNKKFKDFEFVIFNNLQGRIHHILSSLYLITKDNSISFASSKQLVYLITSGFSKELPLDTTVSLIPISKEVQGVKIEGFEYPLDNETLYRAKARGLSNVSIAKKVKVTIAKGELLLVINLKRSSYGNDTRREKR